MSFDKPTRNKLASMVGDCRRLLTDDIRHQLQAVYGLQPDGSALEGSRLAHLDERGREVARALRLWQEHLGSTEPGTVLQKRKAAFDRLAHETVPALFAHSERRKAVQHCPPAWGSSMIPHSCLATRLRRTSLTSTRRPWAP